MENLTLKQKQKIEDSLKQKEEFYKLLQKERYIKEKPIVAYVTKKTYNNGLEKISIKNDVKKEKQPDQVDFVPTDWSWADNLFYDTFENLKFKKTRLESEYAKTSLFWEDINKDLNLESVKNDELTYSSLRSCYVSANRAKQLAEDLALSNKWNYFITLTFDNEKVGGKRLDDDVVRTKLENWLRALRRRLPDVKYILFPEYHPKQNKGLHFHGMLGNVSVDELKLVDSGKVSCHWSKSKCCSQKYYDKTVKFHTPKGADGFKVYNMASYGLGFSQVTDVSNSDACLKYALKYVTKSSHDIRFFNKKRFWASKNLERPYIEKIQLEIGFVYTRGTYDTREYIIDKNIFDELKIDTDLWQISYAQDDVQYLVLSRKLDIIDKSGTVTTIRKTQV